MYKESKKIYYYCCHYFEKCISVKVSFKSFFLWFLIIVLAQSCATIEYETQLSDAQLVSVYNNVASKDSSIIAIIAPYKATLEKKMERPIGYSAKSMSKSEPEGYLNNLIADIVLKETQLYLEKNGIDIIPDFCLLNMGGLRASLPAGVIKVRNIYEIMPFDNLITIVTIRKEEAQSLFDYVAHSRGMPLSGAQMGIRNGQAVDIKIDGKPFNDAIEVYHVVTSDYLADGGDHMHFFSDPVKRYETTYLVRNAIINYIETLNRQDEIIDIELDKRIYIE